MIQINNLLKTFNKNTAVDIPSLTINKGEVVGFIGNNGAGKTTTFRLILDLLQTDTGNVFINGVDVVKNEDWKSYTGSFIDSNFLIDFFTPQEYFTFTGKVYRLNANEVKERLTKFEKFMNGEILNEKKHIRHFSSGNRQKIGIVAAMMIQPEILILDEPFNFLDPSSQIEMKQLLQWLNTQFGTTVLISSHNLNYIHDVSSRILLMEKGVIIKDVINKSAENIADIYQYFNQ
ncbi:MAG: ABC transporter ATP-binding protein [Prevotellaceae bacterium]|jgi:ABC-2 type transport system ATP-binding protein|nr:ABC transporter ATP-binding protein [Prevotellaceae bacterium]